MSTSLWNCPAVLAAITVPSTTETENMMLSFLQFQNVSQQKAPKDCKFQKYSHVYHLVVERSE